QRLGKGSGPGQPAFRTEISVELGLDFLAREQSPDGSWSLTAKSLTPPQLEREKPVVNSDTAATGLALLSFLGAGYDHFDEKYSRPITAGLDWLIKNQAASGDLYVEMDAESAKSAKLYSHGIAAIALCEAYGMTGDEPLREPAQKAIDSIIATQNPQLGGWRYEPRLESDTSVSGWQLMALKSGELAGLKVPHEPYQKVGLWLTKAQANPRTPSQYVYNPYAENTETRRAGRKPSQTMTAVGLLVRMDLGWNRDDKRMVGGADYLLDHLPAIGVRRGENQVDTYYWYYATQVMFHMKGDYWKKWNDRLHPMLVDRQIKEGELAGSWDPGGDKWGDKAGRIYVTTLNLLSLEVYYRHLPIYQPTAT